ncbi:MAG: NAD(P)-dependent oxidoreductase, partial [Candidatus Cloacimonetes bacterium]|nr:NAD(P)-dependent oxidoreductase [Candidatus Cloacimonadota bacterium]
MKIIISGKNGLLGSTFAERNLNNPDVSCLSHQEMDICNYKSITNTIKNYKPNVIINCAAYTDVTSAEIDSEAAFRINSESLIDLSKICKDEGIKLVHFSTDYIFDGSKNEPYLENDEPCPVNKYGLSKLKGEENIRKYCSDFLIIRVSWLYGKNGNNFFSKAFGLLQEKSVMEIVADQYGKTTYSHDVV